MANFYSTGGVGYPALGITPPPALGTPDAIGDDATTGISSLVPNPITWGPSNQVSPTSWLMNPPRATAPRVLRNPTTPNSTANTPLPPVRPNINVPVGQVAGSGGGSFWDALRALFSGQPQAQAQGMTGLLPRGRAGASTDALGNPFNRFG